MHLVVRLVAAAMLVWAIYPHHRGYYSLLRWVTASVLAFGALGAINEKKRGWAWTFGALAVLFNPLLPIYLYRKSIWTWIDIGTAGIIVASTVFLDPVLRSRGRAHDGAVTPEIFRTKPKAGVVDRGI